MSILPSASHHLPMKRSDLPKADLRKPITAWKALVWTYRDECVRAATNATEAARLADTGLAQVQLERDRVSGGGAINGFLEAHEDALDIDRFVYAWFDHEHRPRDVIARHAEAATPVPPASSLEPLRFVPILNRKGMPEILYRISGRRDEPYLCTLTVEGYTPRQIAAHAEFHALFIAMLDVMRGLKLKRWLVTAPGLDSSCRIIDK